MAFQVDGSEDSEMLSLILDFARLKAIGERSVSIGFSPSTH